MKYLIKLIKKIVFSILVIYGIDMILSMINIFIPINIITIGMVTILGIPGLFITLLFKFIFF